MIYQKNLFGFEQIARIIGGLVVAAVPLWTGLEPSWAFALGGVAFSLTGVLGFCPACYMLGRKQPRWFARRVPHP